MKQRKEEQAVSAAQEGERVIKQIKFKEETIDLPKPIFVDRFLFGDELTFAVIKELVKQLVERGAENE